MPRTAGHSRAPPTPIADLLPIRTPIVGEDAPSGEKGPKITAPSMNIRDRPKRSARRPPVTINTPKTTVYPLITAQSTYQGHWRSRSSRINDVDVGGWERQISPAFHDRQGTQEPGYPSPTDTLWAVRILLVSTYELGHQPLHIASPAARLREAGHEVSVVDVSIEPFRAEAAVGQDAVAISVPMHTAMRLAAGVVRSIQSRSPEIPIALYGLYAAMGDPGSVDRVIVGEYEDDLVGWFAGVSEGHVERGPTTSLDRHRFVVPDRSSLPPLDSYAHLSIGDEHRVVGYVEASHGCRHRCRHCPLPAVYDGRFRIVDPAIVTADISRMVEQGARHITFGDPDFFNGVPHAMRVLDAAHSAHPDLTFDVTIKVEHLLDHQDQLRVLAERGVVFVTSAFETTNDRVLELLDKGHTRSDMVEALALARAAGLEIHPSWLPFTPWTDDRRSGRHLLVHRPTRPLRGHRAGPTRHSSPHPHGIAHPRDRRDHRTTRGIRLRGTDLPVELGRSCGRCAAAGTGVASGARCRRWWGCHRDPDRHVVDGPRRGGPRRCRTADTGWRNHGQATPHRAMVLLSGANRPPGWRHRRDTTNLSG